MCIVISMLSEIVFESTVTLIKSLYLLKLCVPVFITINIYLFVVIAIIFSFNSGYFFTAKSLLYNVIPQDVVKFFCFLGAKSMCFDVLDNFFIQPRIDWDGGFASSCTGFLCFKCFFFQSVLHWFFLLLLVYCIMWLDLDIKESSYIFTKSKAWNY